MRKIVLSFLLSSLWLYSAGIGHAESWKLLKEGEGVASIYVDEDSYSNSENLRYFWLRSVMAYPKQRRKKDQKREVRLYHALDCQSKDVYPPVKMKMYRGDGKLLDEVEQKFETIKDGKRNIFKVAAGKKVYESVCGTQGDDTPH